VTRRVLSAAMDDYVQAGLLAPKQRRQVEFVAHYAEHGLALFVIDVPLEKRPRKQIHFTREHLLSMIARGVT
jgi:hypothetical protein